MKVTVCPCEAVCDIGCTVMAGAAAATTVSIAFVEVALPRLLVTVTEKADWSSDATVGAVSTAADVAPGIATPFLYHWNASGSAPDAVTLKCAGKPCVTDVSTGSAMIAGAVAVVICCGMGKMLN